MAYGTLSILDTLAANSQPVREYGEDRVWDALQYVLDAHNELVRGMENELMETTQDKFRRYGGATFTEMIPADEFSTPDIQKVAAGDTVGFPLRLYQYAIGWTRRWLERATVAEVYAQTKAAATADVRALQRNIKYALFNPTNYTFQDNLVDGIDINVRALANADSNSMPPDPYGNLFDTSTHTHYTGYATLTEAALTAQIENVLEHNISGEVIVLINRSQEAAIKAMTPTFAPYSDPRLFYGQNITNPQAIGNLNTQNMYDREIGVFGPARVRVKPWVPNNYIVIYNSSVKPLVMRVNDVGGRENLSLVAESEHYPLRARYFEREYGIAVWNRTAAAILYIGNTTYAMPVL